MKNSIVFAFLISRLVSNDAISCYQATMEMNLCTPATCGNCTGQACQIQSSRLETENNTKVTFIYSCLDKDPSSHICSSNYEKPVLLTTCACNDGNFCNGHYCDTVFCKAQDCRSNMCSEQANCVPNICQFTTVQPPVTKVSVTPSSSFTTPVPIGKEITCYSTPTAIDRPCRYSCNICNVNSASGSCFSSATLALGTESVVAYRYACEYENTSSVGCWSESNGRLKTTYCRCNSDRCNDWLCDPEICKANQCPIEYCDKSECGLDYCSGTAHADVFSSFILLIAITMINV